MASDELVLIHTANGGPGLAVLLRSLLEAEGIQCVIKTESGTVGFALMPPMTGLPMANMSQHGLFDVYVLNRDAERAREILTAAEIDGDEIETAALATDNADHESDLKLEFPRIPGLLLGIAAAATVILIYDLWRGGELWWILGPIVITSFALGSRMMGDE